MGCDTTRCVVRPWLSGRTDEKNGYSGLLGWDLRRSEMLLEPSTPDKKQENQNDQATIKVNLTSRTRRRVRW
jgi:hypothetical protein